MAPAIENGLKAWGEASRCAPRWSCQKNIPSMCTLNEEAREGHYRNDEKKNQQEPRYARRGTTRRRLMAQFCDAPIQPSHVPVQPGGFVR